MDELLDYLRKMAREGAFIGLFAVEGEEGLYERFKFVLRQNDQFGAGMFIPIQNLKNAKPEG